MITNNHNIVVINYCYYRRVARPSGNLEIENVERTSIEKKKSESAFKRYRQFVTAHRVLLIIFYKYMIYISIYITRYTCVF